MLYRLITNSGTFRRLEPVPFKDFSSFGNQEKDLEDLIARNILDMLFEGASPMPIFQVQFDDRCFVGTSRSVSRNSMCRVSVSMKYLM